MNILIFGLGFVGRPLAEKCYEQGYSVRAIKKHLTSDDICLPIDLDTICLNPNVFCADWANYGTWVILLPPSALENYVETIDYLIAQAEQYGIQHLIYTSSTSVFGDGEGVFDEHSPTQAITENAQKIVLIEQKLLNSAIQHVDIIRLGGLYASERHPINSLLKKNQVLPMLPIPNGQQWVNMIHRERAVLGIFQAIQTPSGKRIRHFVETPHLRKIDFYQREANVLGTQMLEFENHSDFLGKKIVSVFDDFQEILKVV